MIRQMTTSLKKSFICFSWLVLTISISSELGFADGRTSANDTELKSLFNELSISETASAADKITFKIWGIWIRDASSDSGRYAMQQGINLINQGRLSAAEKLFSELILKEPNYIEAWNKRATIRFMMGHIETSLDDVSVVLSKEPKHFGAVSGLGLILMKEKDFEGALKAYRKVLKINPFSRDALRLVPILEQRVFGERI